MACTNWNYSWNKASAMLRTNAFSFEIFTASGASLSAAILSNGSVVFVPQDPNEENSKNDPLLCKSGMQMHHRS